MPVTSDCLLSELLGSLRLTFLKIPTRLFGQNRSTQCLKDFFVFFLCFMAFHWVLLLVSGSVGEGGGLCAVESGEKWISFSLDEEALERPVGCFYSPCYCIAHLLLPVPYVFGQRVILAVFKRCCWELCCQHSKNNEESQK